MSLDKLQAEAATLPPLREYARQEARAAHLDVELFIKTIDCESGFDPSIQSNYIDPKTGLRENSWGVVQIFLDKPPEEGVTKEEALDPYFSIDLMARQWKKGNERAWVCWRQLTNSK